jgi:UDP-N-acetylmuramate dehydrogenase
MFDKKGLIEISENVIFDEPMSAHTSFKIGGNADAFASITDIDEIRALIKYCKNKDIPYMIMGNGTNMLVSDKGIRGLVIQVGSGMQDYKIDGENVYAQAGILMSVLSKKILKAELTGFEPLSGIPGTLGGGIYMNAGAYGGEIKDIVDEVTYVNSNGEVKTVKNKDIGFSYRHSMFEDEKCVILSAVLKLKKGNAAMIKSAMDDYNTRRSDKQPLNMPSAGSTFKRPEGYFAGKLIEDSGLVGYSIGGAQVSEKHAGFIVNRGGASAQDVLDLVEHIQKTVNEKFGVKLEPEIRLIGEK